MIREDYLLRMIRQLTELIARAAGFNRRGQYEQALIEAGRGWELLGVPRELIEVVDTETLIGLLREPAKLRTAAQLLAEEARALIGKGDPVNGGELSRRAIELYAAAQAIDPTDDDVAAMLELSRAVAPGTL